MTAIPYGPPLWVFAQIGGSNSGCQSRFPGAALIPLSLLAVWCSPTAEPLSIPAPSTMTGYGQYPQPFRREAIPFQPVIRATQVISLYSSTVNFTVVKDAPAILLTINGSYSAQGIAGQPTVLTVQVTNPSNSQVVQPLRVEISPCLERLREFRPLPHFLLPSTPFTNPQRVSPRSFFPREPQPDPTRSP